MEHVTQATNIDLISPTNLLNPILELLTTVANSVEAIDVCPFKPTKIVKCNNLLFTGLGTKSVHLDTSKEYSLSNADLSFV